MPTGKWSIEDEKRFVISGFRDSAFPVVFVNRYMGTLGRRQLGFNGDCMTASEHMQLRSLCLSLLAKAFAKASINPRKIKRRLFLPVPAKHKGNGFKSGQVSLF